MKLSNTCFTRFFLWVSCLMIFMMGAISKAQAETSLIKAIKDADLTRIEETLNSKDGKTQINQADKRGFSPLDIALYETRSFYAPDIVQLLLKKGAQPGPAKVSSALALSRLACAGGGDEAWLAALAGAKADERMPNGFSAFIWTAICHPDSKNLERLVKAGANPRQNLPADIDMSSPSVILLAARYNPSVEVINTLIRFGANLESRSYFGKTPLIEACEKNKNPRVALALIEAGANVNAADHVSTTPFLASAKNPNALPVLKKLQENGADAFAVDDSGSNALHIAAQENTTLEVFPFLLRQGLPLNQASSKDHQGVTPLMQAVRYNANPQVIRFLLDSGADVSARDADGRLAWDNLSSARNSWLKQNKLNRPAASSAEKKLLGRHMFSLQWISTEKYGEAEITKDASGNLFIKAKQDLNGDLALLNGQITIVDDRTFTVNGQLMTRVSHINGGKSCPRSGQFTFKATGKRKYWRMQEMKNPCDAVIDYVDIYF